MTGDEKRVIEDIEDVAGIAEELDALARQGLLCDMDELATALQGAAMDLRRDLEEARGVLQQEAQK